MIAFLRALRRDKRGNALVIAGASLPFIVAAAGLATDTIQWTLWKRQLQRAADSAAIAGTYARMAGANYSDAVSTDLSKNNHAWMGWAVGYPSTSTPADTPTNSNQVQVTLGIQQQLTFSGMFVSTAPLITASATAAAVDDGNYCVVALESSSTSGVTIGGNANANLGCGVISNSVSSTSSVGTNGNSYALNASPVAAVGGLPTSSLTSHGASNIQPYHVAETDPYAGKYDTSIPAGYTCSAWNSAANSYTSSGGVTHLRGDKCYSDFNPGNGTTVLDPGVYYLNNASISVDGNTTLTGSGVTIVFTGTSPGSISMRGNAVVNLTAPITGTFAKMLMIQSSAATSGNSNTINGNNGANLDGAIYFPRGQMNFTGSSSAATKCLMLVALRVDFGGNTAIQNDTNGCTANTTVTSKKVRLVA